MPDMKLTLQEVEDMRGAMNVAIAEAIKTFEDATGIRTSYIDISRVKDQQEKDGTCCCSPCSYDEDRGDVAAVTVNLRMDL